jgi:soluble lytic murein transglycosylase-like protein/LysM repeat protein
VRPAVFLPALAAAAALMLALAAAAAARPAEPHYLPQPPDRLSLCGQPVPLEVPFVAEQLDREFNIAVHDKAQVVMWLKRAARYFPLVERELAARGMPEDLKYLAVAESALLRRARSYAGAAGVWQFIPATARRYGLRVDRWYDDRRNVAKATRAALDYLRDLHQEFGSWPLAMAAYNCGERRVRRAVAEQGVKDYYHLYLPRETMRYVYRIMAAKIILSQPEAYGYLLAPSRLYPPRPAARARLRLTRSLHLRRLAAATGVTVRELRDLNPELRSYWLPPGKVEVQVPPGRAQGLSRRLAQAGGSRRPPGVTSRPPAGKVVVVRKGDTLTAIAQRHGVRLGELRKANRLSGSLIRPGQKLVIP